MDITARPNVIYVLSTSHIHNVAHFAQKSSNAVIGVLEFAMSAATALPVSSLARGLVAMAAAHDHAAAYVTSYPIT